MSSKMYFVYSLVHDGQIIYIGKCKNLAERYSLHISNSLRHRVGFHSLSIKLQEILSQNKYPLMKIIDYLPEYQALKREKELICLFSLAGQKIYNSTLLHKPSKDYDIYNSTISKKEIKKNLRKVQREKEEKVYNDE